MNDRPTCLIVDDNKSEGKLLSGMLRGGFPDARVVVEHDGVSALEVCRSEQIDCVLIDYNMTVMDGLELGERLRREFAHLPMILMTAVGDEMLAAEALRNGFSDYIPKSRITSESAARVIKRAMQAAEQGRVIEQQRDELEHFAYALAHDFKQPIRQIRTFADLISEEMEVKEGTSAALHMEFLRAASRRLGALVDVMSQYTLLNKTPEVGPVDVNHVVNCVRAGISEFMAERRGAFLSEMAPAIVGNEALLTQVLQNLVVNGLLYNTNERPRVVLRVDTSVEGVCRLRLQDNGIGIEARYLDDIFKPLMRLHASSEFPGTGLGLTITRKAVLAQGGKIWCESKVGEGSEFVVELPRANETLSTSTAENAHTYAEIGR